MIQLTKQGDSGTLYQTIYTEGRLIIQHQGIVGEWVREENVREIRVSRFKRLGVQILQLVEEFERQGYHEVNETDYQELIVQFPYDEGQAEAALERRHMMEEMIDEGLLHTGNGYCEGGDIGSGTTNIFYHVLDVEAAVSLIFEGMKEHDVRGEPIIAISEGEAYTILYPEGVPFDLIGEGKPWSWIPMTQAEDKKIWHVIDQQFQFTPSTTVFPSYHAPSPFITYEVDYKKREEIERELGRILIELTVEGERIMALDWNHQGYWIDPRRPFLRNEEGDWMIPAVPDGDYSFFIARDFRWGYLGHPWEGSITLFGEDLISAFQGTKSFKNEIRKG
ncbi:MULTISPECIES: DUF2716 domain-containing protein [unclassified Exiguobacterium]|uniref:DUF2716 domain-containing protein n=1 Tax=unclassified Exiguobacterium TaxID=2644629 RepID=UPI0020351211|nr:MULTISPECIES: DUF2716 domain-containing protein [unclassified Exiguobacterium]